MNRRALFRAAAGAVAPLTALPLAALAPPRFANGGYVKLSRNSPIGSEFRDQPCRHPRIVNQFEVNGYFTEESVAQIRAMVARDLKRHRFIA